ncbi:hypothetical protein DM860_015022 [Cuscuta australis]|uniref:feruloyl-CoA 6-hydroxylase n=1 Tax=Cuscuta australis TaxID=267555 RepID=A0A328DIW3_9ASTE|nr:hypothetical protein DM860_015022 [Cuscuta australis]
METQMMMETQLPAELLFPSKEKSFLGDRMIDRDFIQPIENRPKLSETEAEGIPLIDLSAVLQNGDCDETIVSQIGNACRVWGFFQVVNHGVSEGKRREMEKVARSFFRQSVEEKREVRRDEENVHGYHDGEHTVNVRDWKEVFEFALESPYLLPRSQNPDAAHEISEVYNLWPKHPPQMRKVSEEYGKEMEKLGFKLMALIARSLGLPADTFEPFYKTQTSTVMLTHYPQCPFPHLALGVGPHSDSGALTILYQDDVGGLEVKRKSDGEWVRVKPIPDAYIINLGAVIQVWANDVYESVEHRVVVNSTRERFSIPFFFNPAHDTMVKPLDGLTDGRNPARYTPYNWGMFDASRKLSNFRKLDFKNVQIDDFKISN